MRRSRPADRSECNSPLLNYLGVLHGSHMIWGLLLRDRIVESEMENNIEATTFYKHFEAVLVGIFQGLLGPRGRPQPVFWLLG